MSLRDHRLARTSSLAAAAMLSASALGAWGGRPAAVSTGSMTASQIIRASTKALAAEKTFVIAGTVRQGSAAITLDLQSARGGTASQGTLTSNSKSVGFVGTLSFVELGGTSYLNAAATFWGQFINSSMGLTAAKATAVVDAIKGKWIELGASETKSFASSLGTFTNPKKFGADLFTNDGALSKGKPTKIRGVAVVPITSSKGGTLYIALDGPPLPLEIGGSGSGSSGKVAFSYPAKLDIVAPRGAKSLTQLVETALG